MAGEQNVDARAVLAESLYANPETRGDFLRLVKKAHPAAPIPELDARDALRAELDPIKKEIEAERAALKKQRDEAWLAEQRRRVAERVGESNVAAVEALMTGPEAVGTHTAAAELWEARNRVATPSGGMGGGPLYVPGMGSTAEDYKGILSNPKWGHEKAHEMIEDFRNGRGSKWNAYV